MIAQQSAKAAWYVVYTYPRAERKIDNKLRSLGINSFLPLNRIVRQWSDRRKKIDVPLFPNYLFVCVTPIERIRVLAVKEVARFVCFEGKPAVISDKIINTLKKVPCKDLQVSNTIFEQGMNVKIGEGQFAGFEGILLRRNGKTRLAVQIEALNTYVSFDVSVNALAEAV